VPELEFDSRRIVYERAGEGTPLVFQHGLGADRSQAFELFKGISGRSVLAADAPSHADSEHAPELHGFDAMADVVAAMMDRESVQAACVGGISMGSGIALSLALRHPERVRGLVLVRPAWLDRPHPDNLELIARLGEWIVRHGPEDARERLDSDEAFRAMREAIPGAAASITSALARCRDAQSGRVLRDMVAQAPFPSLESLRTVRCPALVLACERDPLHPVELARTIASALPDSELREVPARYSAPDEHAEAVRASVTDFVERVSGTP